MTLMNIPAIKMLLGKEKLKLVMLVLKRVPWWGLFQVGLRIFQSQFSCPLTQQVGADAEKGLVSVL